MKKLLFILSATLILISCEKSGNKSLSTLSVEPTALSFTAQATESHDVVVTTNQSSWDAVSSQSWCTITKGDGKFTVRATVNTSTLSPTPAIITITAGSARPVTMNVTQSGIGAELSVNIETNTPILFTSTGGAGDVKTITVLTNQSSWSVVSNQTWCTVNKNGNDFTIITSANTGTDARNAIVTVSAGNAANVTINITQAGVTVEDPNLEKAVYTLGYAANAADQFNDRGLKPSTIILPGTTNHVAISLFYLPNGALDCGTVYIPGGQGSVHSEVLYDIDMGRRPSIIIGPSSSSVSREMKNEAISAVRTGNYDYTNDPVKVLAYFGGWTGSSVFTSLGNLKLITNNSAITEQIYNSISFSTNCYKMIVFGKNRAGKLVGKYVGYSTNGKSYIYWCIDPESSSFGTQASKNTPYN